MYFLGANVFDAIETTEFIILSFQLEFGIFVLNFFKKKPTIHLPY